MRSRTERTKVTRVAPIVYPLTAKQALQFLPPEARPLLHEFHAAAKGTTERIMSFVTLEHLANCLSWETKLSEGAAIKLLMRPEGKQLLEELK